MEIKEMSVDDVKTLIKSKESVNNISDLFNVMTQKCFRKWDKIMGKWRDIRCDFFNEEEEKYIVNAWKTNNDSEEGMVIAKLDLANGTVEYIDEDTKTDEYAQIVIKEMLENGYILTEWGG